MNMCNFVDRLCPESKLSRKLVLLRSIPAPIKKRMLHTGLKGMGYYVVARAIDKLGT